MLYGILTLMTRLIIFLTAFLISFPAYSYIDPGLGNILLQSFIGSIAVALGFTSIFWQRIKSYIFKIKKKPKQKKIIKNENPSE